MIHEIEPHLVAALLDRLDPAPSSPCGVEGCRHWYGDEEHEHDVVGLAYAA